MIHDNEHLRALERFSGKETRATVPEMTIDQTHAHKLLESRKTLLGSIDRDITPALYDALRAKIEYEYSYLLGIIELNAKLTETREHLNKVLKAEYFIRKPLDTNIF